MKQTQTLKDFTKQIIHYLGSGYTHAKVVKIPPKKRHKSYYITKKVSEYYGTNISRGRRQQRRRKGLVNYAAVAFQDRLFVLLRTNGEHNNKPNEFIKVSRLKVELSKWIALIFFRNEEKRWTCRLAKETYRRFKEDFHLAIKNGNGYKYNQLCAMWKNLPHWRGIGRQTSELHKYIKEQKQLYSREWSCIVG